MILGDNPTGHGFVLRNLVLIELSGYAPPFSLRERGKGGGKNFRKNLAGWRVRNFNFGGGGSGRGGAESHNFEVKINCIIPT